MRRGETIRWILFIIPLALASVVVWAGIQGYQRNSHGILLIDPNVLSFVEAVREADLIVVGRAVLVDETLLETTEDGWVRPVAVPSRHAVPYTDFRIEVADVVYAVPGWDSGKQVIVRTLGGSSIGSPDAINLQMLLQGNGKPHVFFLRRSPSPYDPDTWRLVDSVHLFPVEGEWVLPNPRGLEWRVDTIRSPIPLTELKRQVNEALGIPPGSLPGR